MPGLAQRNEQFSSTNASSAGVYSISANGFWSKHRDDVSYNQLQKFWSELTPQARHKLLRIDKQTLFEQARKNMYCSRCNGLLLEGFLQIVMYGKSLHQEGLYNRSGASKNQNDVELNIVNGCQDEIQDPAVHPWGGLTTTRDGTLTLLNCYLCTKSLKGLQNVFDSARARERERELLYPDACGGGGRGWISQGIASYGRGHGTRETCALHTARLSCDTLVDFWSALGEETRQSLLKMKEEDFIERLMYRFDSKRFCRDCRRNVIREFKELKELKRMRREPRCNSWFCVADTAFQYEVSDDTIQADWRQTFADTAGSYHHFEWAVGTGEGKSDIIEFENVGMNGSVQVDGLDLGGLTSCFITLRAWKLDGRCTELSVKAHALRGQPCVHCRLVVGDGFVTITRGESIRRFFEHAEEAEEEEDDDSMDKDGNELDGECSRPQKHAKSPELAREFLLDAATVIFKEQVEKAFREGTARQNAHSIFVCLALKLLEERVHVACKEIITLEKQTKLLEEEEKEKREEEERKERRRTKEREKKLRRKERLKGKEKDKEQTSPESNDNCEESKDEISASVDDEPNNDISCRDSVSETGEDIPEEFSDETATSTMQTDSYNSPDGEFIDVKDGSDSFTSEQSKSSNRRLKFQKEAQLNSSLKWSDRRRFTVVSENAATVNRSESRHYSDNFETLPRGINGSHRASRINGSKSNGRNCGHKFTEKLHCPNNRTNDRYDFHSCNCHQNNEYRVKAEPHVPAVRPARDCKLIGKSEPTVDMSKQFYRSNKYGQTDFVRESSGRPKSKSVTANNSSSRDLVHSRKVWEAMESHKKYPRSNSDSNVTLRSSNGNLVESSGDLCCDEVTESFGEIDHEENDTRNSDNSSLEVNACNQNGHIVEVKDSCYQKETSFDEVNSCPAKNSALSGSSEHSTSNSDNCSSCLSEGDSVTALSNHSNLESSSTSDSEDTSQHSEGRETLSCQNGFSSSHDVVMENKPSTNGMTFGSRKFVGFPVDDPRTTNAGNMPAKANQHIDSGIPSATMSSHHQGVFPPLHNQNLQYPVFQAPTLNYYHQNPVAWPAAAPIPFTHPNHYLYAAPLNYGLNGNSRLCMQYSPMQHLASPMFNPGPVPVYQPIGKANVLNSDEHTKTQEISSETKTEKKNASPKSDVPSRTEGGKTDHPTKVHVSDTNFSLFHFGGPLASLSTGCKQNPLPSDGIVGDFSSKISADQVENDTGCIKKESTMEEYNLFAASNGLRFSFF
ncbi:hypothetical protein M5689_015372 [Euphorbia peplus]|nr:hypothetical protein M5689_015372 [Euphorbia peplus]